MRRGEPVSRTWRRMLLSGARPVPPPTSSKGGAGRLGSGDLPIDAVPQGSFEMQHGAAHLLGKHLLREFTSWSSAHVQLERARVVRRRGDGEAAPPALGQQDVEVLARLEIETLR